MKYVVSFLERADAAIQKRFDSVCFFLMLKFGLKKSVIRYRLQCCCTFTFFGPSLAMLVQARIYGGAAFVLFLLALFAWSDVAQYEEDREAESRATSILSGSDLRQLASATLLMKCALLAVSLWLLVTAVYVRYKIETMVCMLGLSLACFTSLLLLYLAKTPMNPPAEKAREHVGTPQTAPAQT
ncbi:MAG: hypothetical protein WC866_00275 [Patescibacteria group bacterium]